MFMRKASYLAILPSSRLEGSKSTPKQETTIYRNGSNFLERSATTQALRSATLRGPCPLGAVRSRHRQYAISSACRKQQLQAGAWPVATETTPPTSDCKTRVWRAYSIGGFGQNPKSFQQVYQETCTVTAAGMLRGTCLGAHASHRTAASHAFSSRHPADWLVRRRKHAGLLLTSARFKFLPAGIENVPLLRWAS